MCGIAAFSGKRNLSKEQALIAVNKMKILGLYNESRGSHGCGLYINGNIHKGIEDLSIKKDTKLFHKFIADPEFIWPKLDMKMSNVMILHTRQATLGAHTEANTHPFRIHSQDPINDIVGVHNGTIDNIWDLCKKNNFDYLDKHIRVDSHALYYLIDLVGLDILTQYRGYAALVWSKPSDPNSLFVYHGLSKKDRTDQRLYVERPMFYLKTPEGIFFSSLENSLNAIRESDKQEVVELECNQVLQVTNGEFTDYCVKIDRVDANLPIYVQHPIGVQQGHTQVQGFGQGRRSTFNNLHAAVNKKSSIKDALGTPNSSLVWRETKPAKALAAKDQEVVFFWKGRYYRSGGDILCKDLLWIGERGVIGQEGDEGVKACWFFDGAMMRSQEAYETLVEESNLPNSWVRNLSSNYAYDISRFTAHPVTHLTSESVDADPFFKYSWYLDEKRVTCNLRPDFSGRCYKIQDGFLKEIVGSNGNDKNTVEGVMEAIDAEDELVIDGQTYPASSRNPVFECSDGECSPKAVPWRADTSVFDIVFADIKVVCDILDKEEVEALASFVEDQLKKDGFAHDPQTVQAEMWTAIRTGCVCGKTIREAVGDKTCVLESYILLLREEKSPLRLPALKAEEPAPFEVDSIEAMLEAGESVMNNMQQEYAKYANRGSEDTPFPHNLDEIVANGSFHVVEDEPEQTDEPLIDAAMQEDYRRGIDPDFRRIQQKHIEEEGQLVEAIKGCEEVVNVLGELSNNVEQLSVNQSDLAADVCFTLQKGLEGLKASLTDDFDRHHQDALTRSLFLEVPSNI